LLALKMRSCEFSSAHQTAMKMCSSSHSKSVFIALDALLFAPSQPRRVVEHYKFLSADLHRELGVWAGTSDQGNITSGP